MNKKYKKRYEGKKFADILPSWYEHELPVWEIQVSDTRAYRIAHEWLWSKVLEPMENGTEEEAEEAVRIDCGIAYYVSPYDSVFDVLSWLVDD